MTYLSYKPELFGIKLFILIVILLAYLILKYANNKEQNKINSIVRQEINQFKSESIKSTINFSEIEFFSNSWKKSIVVGSGLNTREELIDVHENTLLIRKVINNSTYDIKVEIEMEPTTLKMKIAMKNDIDFYYNPKNPNEYHIDFSFLGQPS
ncbi:hypothetical protein [Flavobacterium sp.]|uniref:hypothetical protein n=1 Tax=Flavobacterium sp. TaxID=239 RepID=UPI002620A139|nr:hypothetical protein [Flavobacterium sp.]